MNIKRSTSWGSARDLPAPSSSTSTIGPIIGVVDGSNAAPGEVGEFLEMDGSTAFAAYPAVTQGTITLLNVPPGDWDFTVSATVSTDVGGAFFVLAAPVPVGMSNKMNGFQEDIVAELEVGTVIVGQSARGSFAVTTLLKFTTLVDQSTNNTLLAGTMSMHLEARRRR